MVPFLAARLFNASRAFRHTFSPIDMLYFTVKSRHLEEDWCKEMMRVCLGGEPRVETMLTNWTQHLVSQPLESFSAKCFKKAVMVSPASGTVRDHSYTAGYLSFGPMA